MIRPAGATAAFLVIFSVSRGAWAGAGSIDVTTAACPYLHAAEIERVLDIELATVSDQWSGPENLRAELSCDEAHLTVIVVDPLTDKRLTRVVPLDWRAGDHDRTVALLISQLFLTSWTELILGRRADAPRDLPPPPAAPPAAARAAESIVRSSLPPADVRGTIALLGGPRVRSLATPLVSGRAAIRPALLVGRHGQLFLDLGYERGSAERSSGTVGFSLASASLGIGWRAPLGVLSLEVDLGGGAAYADMQGNPSPTTSAASASGLVGEVFVDAGPTWKAGPTRLGLMLSAGLTGPRTVAHVAADRDVSLGGPWIGASLVVGLAESGR